MRQDNAQSIYSSLRITNSEDQIVADKFRFFSDNLAIICHKSGEYLNYELENHISLLNHAIFIADCTIERPNNIKYCIKHLKYLFNSHPLFNSKDTILNEKEIKTQIDHWLDKIQNEPLVKNGLENLKNVRTFINKILLIIEPDYLNVVVKAIYTKFGCKHTLKHHYQDFESLARIIFSWYYLQGHSREAISQFVRKALSSEVTIQGKNIYTETYLPQELYIKQIAHNKYSNEFNQELHDEIVKYVKNRGTEGQAKCFGYISHYESHVRRLFFRLDGLIILNDDDDELNALGIKIISIHGFKKKYADHNYKSYTRGFFSNEKHSAVVEIELKAFTIDDAVYMALEELNNRLGKIMRMTNCRFSVNSKHYAILIEGEGKEFWTNSMPELAKISDYSIDAINQHETILSHSRHKDFYLELDYILQQSYLEDNITTSIHFYRKYMDVLFRKIDDCGIKDDDITGIPQEILSLAYLLQFTEKKKFQIEIRLWAHNRIMNSVFSQTSNNQLGNSYRENVRSTNVFPSFKNIVEHIVPEQHHTKFETIRAMNYSRRFDRKASFDFYVRQLLYIKQYRDKHEHINITEDTISRKLNLYFYKMLSLLHRDLFNELNKDLNQEKTHGEILKDMILKSKFQIASLT